MKLIVDEMARFRMLVAGIMVSLAVSTMYGFSLFTEELKDKYGFTQSDLTTISTVCSVLGYCAFFFGMLLDYAGPKVQLVISGFCALVGLGLFGLALDDKIHSDSRQTMLILMCIFNGIMYFGCPAMDGGSVIPLLMNFPINRGHIIIIQKTFAGLGSSILMTYFDAYFKGSTTADTKFSAYAYFLGFQALFCTCFGACILDFPVYNPCDRVKKMLSATELLERTDTLAIYLKQRAPFRRILIGSAIVVALLIHLTVSSIVGAYSTISKGSYIAVWVVAILLLTSTAVVALPFQFLGRYTVPSRPSSRFKGLAELDESASEQPFDEVEEKKEVEMVVEQPILTSSGRPQYQGSFWSHLLTADLWLLFLTFFGAWGTSTVFQYNSAQVYRSKSWGAYTNSGQAFNVALIGVGSALGRCAGGLLDIYASKPHPERKYPVYTTRFLPVCPSLMVLGFLLMILVPGNAIVFPFILTAMGNGMSWGLAAVIVRLVYAKDMGKHYNFLFASGIIATVGLNRFMFGDMFDHYATVQGTSPYCDKPSCVTNQLWILLSCNVLSTFAAVGLHWRFSRFSNAELKKIGPMEGEDIV